MNKFKKSSKSKSLTFGIAILSSAAIVSTGFAAWVITGGAEASVSGTITADTVENHEHTIKFENDATNLGSIFFGAPTNPTGTPNWLGANGTEKEKLSIKTTFTVANVTDEIKNDDKTSFQKLFDDGDGKTRFEETTGGTDATKKYKTLSDKTYLADLPTILFGDTSDSVGVHITFVSKDVDNKNTATFNLKIVFGWGDYFKNSSTQEIENPYVFYNNKEKNGFVSGTSGTTWKQDAEAKLDEISKMKANFKLTLVTK